MNEARNALWNLGASIGRHDTDLRTPYLTAVGFAMGKLLLFTVPDFATILQSATYWNVLQMPESRQLVLRKTILNELGVQIPALDKACAARPGLPGSTTPTCSTTSNSPTTSTGRTP
ncbi:hypothetical protein [Kitasatospora sp. NPDC096204]|uniref:hypothetical protein n=1 Tax=Kitasatospora sp. NPDC096204 TaxID=3364094 RepID=UPI003813A85F